MLMTHRILRFAILLILPFNLLGYTLADYKQLYCRDKPCRNSGLCNEVNPNITKYGIQCSCITPFIGSFCEIDTTICSKTPCLNNGYCQVIRPLQYKCFCKPGFAGKKCEYIDECKNKPDFCKHEGECFTDITGHIRCRCNKLSYGPRCEHTVLKCPDNYNLNREMCNNRGECSQLKNSSLSCRCDKGYLGNNCQLKDYCYKACLNGGVCTYKNYRISCLCPPGYGGDKCANVLTIGLEEKELPKTGCSTGCTSSKLNNGICDIECNTASCGFDNGNCGQWNNCYPNNPKLREFCYASSTNNKCDNQCNNADCLFDGGECLESKCSNISHCQTVYENHKCDYECNNPQCGFDGGDCVFAAPLPNYYLHVPFFPSRSAMNTTIAADGSTYVQKNFHLYFKIKSSITSFNNNRREFLRLISISIKMPIIYKNHSPVVFNNMSLIETIVEIDPYGCINYGESCFSNLNQTINFLRAQIFHDPQRNNVPLKLPLEIVYLTTREVTKQRLVNPQKSTQWHYILLGFGGIIISILLGVLYRDKLGRIKTVVKTSGTWTPSMGYCTSTSSIYSNTAANGLAISGSNNNTIASMSHINSNELKMDFSKSTPSDYNNLSFLHYKDVKKHDSTGQHGYYNQIMLVSDQANKSQTRKRKYDNIEGNDKEASFQMLSTALENGNGLFQNESDNNRLIQLINSCVDSGDIDSRYNRKQSLSNNNQDSLGYYTNNNGESLLHIAARMNCSSVVIKRLHNLNGSMIHFVDKWGRTPAAVAASSDAIELTELLTNLEKQSRKEIKQQNKLKMQQQQEQNHQLLQQTSWNNQQMGTNTLMKKTTALIEAVKINSMDIVQLLLDESIPVNMVDGCGRSVVHWAAILNNVDLLQRISQMKVFNKLVDMKDNEDKTPLYLASSEGCLESVKFISNYIIGANLKLDSHCPCPLRIALDNGHEEIVELLKQINIADLRTSSDDSESDKASQKRLSKRKSNAMKLQHQNNLLGVIREHDYLPQNGENQEEDDEIETAAAEDDEEDDDVDENEVEDPSRFLSAQNVKIELDSISSHNNNTVYSFCKDDYLFSNNGYLSPYNRFYQTEQHENIPGYSSTNSSSDLSPAFPNLPLQPPSSNNSTHIGQTRTHSNSNNQSLYNINDDQFPQQQQQHQQLINGTQANDDEFYPNNQLFNNHNLQAAAVQQPPSQQQQPQQQIVFPQHNPQQYNPHLVESNEFSQNYPIKHRCLSLSNLNNIYINSR